MQSHTVPRKLLEQFTYDDPRTRSKRLWRYERGREPYPKASPRTATRIDSHFLDPNDAAKETELEKRLNEEFENPVNQFLFEIADPRFVPSDLRRKQLTFYVTLLFLRSEARRRASMHLLKVSEHALNLFLNNERQVQTVAAHWSINLHLSGRIRSGIITREQVIAAARRYSSSFSRDHRAQQNYVGTIERAMSEVDQRLLDGEWNCLRTSGDKPFIISDAPVVTWERLGQGHFNYGMGFHRPNVEVCFPLSPTVCLHIQPDVPRNRSAVPPTVDEVNAAQAAFATKFCFSNVSRPDIDRLCQQNFGKAELGVKSFTVWHRNYESAFFDILMNDGKWVEPPHR